MSLISVVIPVLNERECLEAFYERICKVKAAPDDTFEYIFVDDGSIDGSRDIILKLASEKQDVKYLLLSRNFGHEATTTAGIEHASGDAVIIIDADLQDPPEVIPELIAEWRKGGQIVYARRKIRKGEPVRKRLSSWLFYRILRKLSAVDIPVDTGDFRLIDKCVVEAFIQCREKNRFVRGLISWTGFKQVPVLYDRDERYAGQTKYNFITLLKLATDVLIGFSNVPLRIGMIFGFLFCAISLLLTVFLTIRLLFGIEVSLTVIILTLLHFLIGIQLLMMGLIGEYVGRIYSQVQNRPLYISLKKSKTLRCKSELQE